MKTRIVKLICSTILVSSIGVVSGSAGEFKFPVGVTYADGIFDASDALEDLYVAAGFTTYDDFVVPLSISFTPYYEFDMGLGVGLDLGPVAFFVVETDTFSGGSTSTDTAVSYIIPVGFNVRYTFMRDEDFSPYVRVGARFPIAGGDNIASSTAGAYGAVGMELWQSRSVGMAIEVGYDTSKVEFEGPNGNGRSEVDFPGFTASVLVTF